MVLGLLPFANQRTWQPSHSPTQSLLDYSVQLWHPDISSKGYYHLPIKGPGNSGILTYLPKATTICQSKDLASHPTCPTQSLLDYSVQLWHPEISSKGYYHLPIKGPGNSGILTYLPKATTICQSKDLATIPLAQPNHSWITLSNSGILTYLPKATTICQSKDLASHPTCPTQSLLDYSVQLWHPEISSKGYYHLPIKGPGNSGILTYLPKATTICQSKDLASHPTCPTQSLLDYSVQLWHPEISSKGYYHLPIKGPGNHPTCPTQSLLDYSVQLWHPDISSKGYYHLPIKGPGNHPTCPTQSLLDYSVQLWHPDISSKGYYHLPIKGPGNHPTCPTQSLLDYSVQLWHPEISSKGYYHLPIIGPGK
ncbi:hypothetical protein PGT21_000910 [Puccinia graminis f. sp. tritici]|uniref:Uncharacterized protein n=1 Tax=Puccinia graminis f. sp. tritici TaxID=56615 RepID=A0A5B0MFP1_PUCGR|nr:hypothetical protein PGT21_000910 [Puccinia graminis f. sp. tritici]